MINILDNACKFTPRGGSIELRGYPYFWDRRKTKSSVPPAAERRRRTVLEPTAYRIDIRDSGSAIPAEHLDHIFEEYTSYAGGRDRSGGGLGLAIVRMIVNQHEGHVWAENTEVRAHVFRRASLVPAGRRSGSRNGFRKPLDSKQRPNKTPCRPR